MPLSLIVKGDDLDAVFAALEHGVAPVLVERVLPATREVVLLVEDQDLVPVAAWFTADIGAPPPFADGSVLLYSYRKAGWEETLRSRPWEA
jgi:hypothetical protein